jgi:hypothetical protein
VTEQVETTATALLPAACCAPLPLYSAAAAAPAAAAGAATAATAAPAGSLDCLQVLSAAPMAVRSSSVARLTVSRKNTYMCTARGTARLRSACLRLSLVPASETSVV